MGLFYTPYFYANIDPTVQAWANSLSATPSSNVLTHLSSFVAGLKYDGVWSKIDRMWVHATETQQQATRDLVMLQDATRVGSPTFIALSGYAFVQASKYLTTTYDIGSNATGWTQNSAHLGLFITSTLVGNGTNQQGDIGMGSVNTFNPFSDTSQVATKINTSGASNTVITGIVSAAANQFLISTRTGANVTSVYRNGSFVFSGTQVSTTIASISPSAFWIGTSTASGGANIRNVALSFWGGGLTATDVTNFNNRVQTLKAAIGF
jgi:hypothetical protein